MTGRLTSTAGSYGAFDEKIEKMFNRKKGGEKEKQERRNCVRCRGSRGGRGAGTSAGDATVMPFPLIAPRDP